MPPDEPQHPDSQPSSEPPSGESGNGKAPPHHDPTPSHGAAPPPLPLQPGSLPHMQYLIPEPQQPPPPPLSGPFSHPAEAGPAHSHDIQQESDAAGVRPPSPSRAALVTTIFILAAITLTLPTWGAFLPKSVRTRLLGESAAAPDVSPQMAMQAKIAIGAANLLGGEAGQSLPEKTRTESSRSFLEGVLEISDEGVIPLVANKLIFCEFMEMGSVCDDYIASLQSARPTDEPPLAQAATPTTPVPDPNRDGAAEERLRGILLRLYQAGQPPLPEELDLMKRRLGFFGELAEIQAYRLAGDPGKADELAQRVREECGVFAVRLMSFTALGVVLALVGSLTLMMFVAGAMRRSVTFQFRPSSPAVAFPFFETFTFYLIVMLTIPFLMSRIAPLMGADATVLYLGLNLIMDVFLLWLAALPVLQSGINWKKWRELIGWTRGEGVLKEIGVGVLGYAASLPLLALGVVVVIVIQALTGVELDQATHPIYPVLQKFRDDPLAVGLMITLAVVGAPVVEETLFRGALHRGLRARFGRPAAIGLNAALFAAVHPQGLMGFPLLFAIGLTLSGLREWRGSLIAPMVAHGLNNGLTMALALSLM